MKHHFKGGVNQTYSAGQIIQTNDETFYLKRGYVAVYAGEGNAKRLLFIHRPNEILPLIYQYLRLPSGRTLEYKALTTAAVTALPTPIIEERMLGNPDGTKKLLRETQEFNSILLDRVVDLEQTSMQGRLVARLSYMAKRFGEPDMLGDGAAIQVPMTYTDLAMSIGTTRETVNRLMSRFQKQQILTVKRKIIYIKSLKALQKLRG